MMTQLRVLWAKVKAFLSKEQLDRDFDEELESHLEFSIEEGRKLGLNPEQARREALLKLGGFQRVKELHREARGFPVIESILQDFRYAVRILLKTPVFTLVVVGSLTLGIGANTAVFTVIRVVLLKPLGYRDPDQLVRVSGGSSWVRFEEMKTAARSFTELGAFLDLTENLTLSASDGPQALKAARVSANFLRILGVEPVLGRSFLPEEDTSSGPLVAIISTELWQTQFGGDRMIAGKAATLAGIPHTIVGVLPAGFQFPFSGIDVWVTKPSAWSMIPPQSQSRLIAPILGIFGRLRPQMSVDQAISELGVINRQYAIAHPGMLDVKPNLTDRVTPLKDQLVRNVRSILWMLFGAVGFGFADRLR
jgi:putative ABC transport system permease protein